MGMDYLLVAHDPTHITLVSQTGASAGSVQVGETALHFAHSRGVVLASKSGGVEPASGLRWHTGMDRPLVHSEASWRKPVAAGGWSTTDPGRPAIVPGAHSQMFATANAVVGA